VDTMTNLMAGGEAAHRLMLEAALKRDDRIRCGLARLESEEPDETLVEDDREALRPAQHVERKLVSMLQASPVLVSQLQKDARPRAR
jgi:hypothetical protein